MANAGPDQVVDVGADGYGIITLDASVTIDPDGDELSYWWMIDDGLLANGTQPTVELPPGRYSIQLVVRDPADHVSTDEVMVTVNAQFTRGDSNTDGVVDVSDAVHLLLGLYTDRIQLRCPDAADANDDGILDLSDAIYELGWLFHSTAEPPPPGTFTPGLDPTSDTLHCNRY